MAVMSKITTEQRHKSKKLAVALLMLLGIAIVVSNIKRSSSARVRSKEKEETIKALRLEFEAEKSAAIAEAVKANTLQLTAEKEEAVKKCEELVEQLKAKPTVEECRGVFKFKGQGGNGESPVSRVPELCSSPGNIIFNVCDDLRNFTGLASNEFNRRIARKGIFHFEAEQEFWNPSTATELAWYYAHSVDYLFANALHGVWPAKINAVASKEFEPVLDYSGGVGNNVIYLAQKGIRTQYFGIGLAEYQFTQYRIWKKNLAHLVEFKRPFSAKTGYKFDPINGPLPRDGSLGGILAVDVFEHIPKYHLVVEAMVQSLRVGGIIVEVTPFAKDEVEGEDLRIHLHHGGITMEQAMGSKMQNIGDGLWKKIAE